MTPAPADRCARSAAAVTAAARPAAVVVAAVTLVGLVLTAVTVAPAVRLSPASVVAGAGVAAAVTALVWFLLSRSAAWTPMGWRPIVPLAWGGVATTAPVLASADAATAVTANLGVPEAGYAFGGAWPEETAKLAGVALVLLVFGARWRRPWDGLACGALVGLGFELVETAQYAVFGAIDDPNSDLAGFVGTWVARGIVFPGLHVFCTGIAGWALGAALLAPGRSRAGRAGVAAAGFAVAFVLHFLWNYEWPGVVRIAVHAAVWSVAAGLFAWAWARAARRARRAAEEGAAAAG